LKKVVRFEWEGKEYTVPKITGFGAVTFFEIQETLAKEKVVSKGLTLTFDMLRALHCPEEILKEASPEDLSPLLSVLVEAQMPQPKEAKPGKAEADAEPVEE